jgi:lipopolysaccharide/colanic/teichoic acid biosynthesis glycosyltransferase
MYRYFFKRLIDFILALIATTVLLPILLPVAIGLLATGEHYVFHFS